MTYEFGALFELGAGLLKAFMAECLKQPIAKT